MINAADQYLYGHLNVTKAKMIRNETIYKLYKKGKSLSFLAERYGISKDEVVRILKRFEKI